MKYMAEIKINNMVKFYTLCLLASGPKHGYDLIKDLDECVLSQEFEKAIGFINETILTPSKKLTPFYLK